MEMLAANKVKMSGSEKKVNRNTYNISSIKRVTRKFLEVLHYSLAKQRQRNVQKSVLHVNRCLFLTVSLALHDFTFCLSKLIILKRASLLALAKSIYDIYSPKRCC